MKMGIGDAVEVMRKGHRVAREGWNGKGMWLALVRDWKAVDTTPYVPGWECNLQFIAMKTAQGDFVPWLCSQTDLLAEDWCVVHE